MTITPPDTASLDGGWVHFDCDDFELDARPAPFIAVTLDYRDGDDFMPASVSKDTSAGAFGAAANRVRNGRSLAGWVYERRGDTWHRIESKRATRAETTGVA